MHYSRIGELRTSYKYSQKFVSEHLNVSQPQYYKLEKGLSQITLDKVKLLASLYNTSIDYIIERTDNPSPYPESKIKTQD